jgi:hypothetical protein
MYIELFGSSDRIGGNIVDMLSQIIFAHKNNYYIKYNREWVKVYNSYNQRYNNSIFMQTIFNIIDEYNLSFGDVSLSDKLDLEAPSHFEVLSKTTLNIKQDLISYFKDNLFSEKIKNFFSVMGKNLGYSLPFNPKKTVVVHHRLEDVRHRLDYDGSVCANFMKNLINSNVIPNNSILNLSEPNPQCHLQSPLSTEKLLFKIEDVLKNKSDHEILIVTSPNEELNDLPYKKISNDDEFYDLFLLSNCDTIILSRSNYALSSLFFGNHKEVHIPLWGHVPCYGLYTKYDKTNFKYFI